MLFPAESPHVVQYVGQVSERESNCLCTVKKEDFEIRNF